MSIDRLKEIIQQRDRTADIHAFADAGLSAFGGIDELISQIKLLYDDERTQIPVKARLLEMVVDFIKESSKTRMSAGIADGLTEQDLENALTALMNGQNISP